MINRKIDKFWLIFRLGGTGLGLTEEVEVLSASRLSAYESILTLPELNTHVTRTQHSRYQNQKLTLPEPNTHVTRTQHHSYHYHY